MEILSSSKIAQPLFPIQSISGFEKLNSSDTMPWCNMTQADVSFCSVSSGWTTPSWTNWGEKAFATSVCSFVTMTSTSSRGTSSTSLRRCRLSAAWPGTSVSNSTTRRSGTQQSSRRSWKSRSRRCRVIAERHRRRSPPCPPPGPLTLPRPPEWDLRVGWPRRMNQCSRDRPRPPESHSRPRPSPPSLLTRPKHTRVRVFHWNHCTRDGRPSRSPRFQKAAANQRSSTSDAAVVMSPRRSFKFYLSLKIEWLAPLPAQFLQFKSRMLWFIYFLILCVWYHLYLILVKNMWGKGK